MPRIFDDITYKDTPVKYVGTDNTQFKALSEDASLQRNTADSAVFKALETNNALKVEDRNAPIKKAALDQLKQTLDQIKNNGTSMGAVSIINQATSDWTNNGALQEAIKSKKDEDLHIATIKKLYEDGDMSKENYEMNQVKTKEMNQAPLVYNTNTYTAENMFKGYRPTSDNKIKKEIYDKADLRQKDFLKSGVIFANGKTYKIDKTNGIGRVLVDGKEVTKQRVYEAIYQEVANEYKDFISEQVELEKFNKTYDKVSGQYRNLNIQDLPYANQANQIDKLLTEETGVSQLTLDKLSKDKSKKGQELYNLALSRRNSIDFNNPTQLNNFWQERTTKSIIDDFVNPASIKGSGTEYDHHLFDDKEAELDLNFKHAKELEDLKAAAKKAADGNTAEYQARQIPEVPASQSPIALYSINDFADGNAITTNLQQQITEKQALLDKETNSTVRNTLNKEIKVLKDRIDIDNEKRVNFLISAGQKDEKHTTELVNSYLNTDEFINDIISNPAKYPTKLLVKARDIVAAKEANKRNSFGNSDIQFESQTSLNLLSNDDIKLLPQYKEILKNAIGVTQTSKTGVPLSVSNALQKAYDENLTTFGFTRGLYNFNKPIIDKDQVIDRGQEEQFNTLAESTKDLIVNTASNFQFGSQSLDAFVHNSDYKTYYMNGDKKVFARPELSTSEYIYATNPATGEIELQVRFKDKDKHELSVSSNKTETAAIQFFKDKNNVLTPVVEQAVKFLKSSAIGATQSQGYDLGGFLHYGKDLDGINETGMQPGDIEYRIITLKNGSQITVQIEKKGKGFEIKRKANGEFIPFMLNTFRNNIGDTKFEPTDKKDNIPKDYFYTYGSLNEFTRKLEFNEDYGALKNVGGVKASLPIPTKEAKPKGNNPAYDFGKNYKNVTTPIERKSAPKLQHIDTSDAIKTSLKEDDNLSVGQKMEMVYNGVKKNLIQEPIANIESWYDELFADKVKYPDSETSKLRTHEALEKIKVLKDKQYALKKELDKQKYFKDMPAIKTNDAYDLDKLEFGYRNRGYKPNVSTKGVILQLHNPITDELPQTGENKQLIAYNRKTQQIEFPNNPSDIKDKSNYVYTTQNKYKVTDFDIFSKIKDTQNGTGTWFPNLTDKNGKKYTYHVGAKMGDNNIFGGLYGGKMLVISEDGKYKMLFVGSVAKLQKDFYNFKDKTNSKELTVVQLDEGSHNRPMIPQDNKMDESDWSSYDAMNNLGGHAFYIKGETNGN